MQRIGEASGTKAHPVTSSVEDFEDEVLDLVVLTLHCNQFSRTRSSHNCLPHLLKKRLLSRIGYRLIDPDTCNQVGCSQNHLSCATVRQP